MNVSWITEAPYLAIDIETYDPELTTKGPGVPRGIGYVLGVAIATAEQAVYLDLQHCDTSAEQREQNLRIITDALRRPVPKIGANLLYDLEWLINGMGLEVQGPYYDVQYAEPLLNEYRDSYSLSALAKAYGVQEKATELLTRYAQQNNLRYKKDPREVIYKMPASVVQEYAKLDGILPSQIFAFQEKELREQELWELFTIECGLMPLLLCMRKHGVRIDVPEFRRKALAVADLSYTLEQTIYEWAHTTFNIASSAQLAKVLMRAGVPVPMREPTELMQRQGKAGNPRLDKATLQELAKEYDICAKILELRHYNTLMQMFFKPYRELIHNGRLYCNFHPLRSDNYGAVSGRFSSSRPNLQQVSAQKEEDAEAASEGLSGQILRKVFVPEDGYLWAKLDYSQVEYRIAAHYAIGPGADAVRRAYNADPNTDYHQHIQDLTGFDRRTAKRLNFGASYGMGVLSAAKLFGWSVEEAELFLMNYHKAAPYLRITRNRVIDKAERVGYVYTILKRRARTHPSRKVHSMYNRLIQGSAADIMKKAMVDAWQAGLFDALIPHITVHDELDVSVPPTQEGKEALSELKRAMEQCVTLKVPLIVDVHTGQNWSEAD